MKKLLNIFVLIILLLTSILYIELYEYKSTRNLLWKNDQVTDVGLWEIKKFDNQEDVLKTLKEISIKHNINISKVRYIDKSSKEKRKIKVYTTLNSEYLNNNPLILGKYLNNDDSTEKFLSSESTNDPNQVGQIKFFNLNSDLEIFPLEKCAEDGHNIASILVNTVDSKILNLLKQDIENNLQCDVQIYKPSKMQYLKYGGHNQIINAYQSMEFIVKHFKMIGFLIIFCALTFLTMIFSMFIRYKELAVRKMFGSSNLNIAFKVIFKEVLLLHIRNITICGILITLFLTYKIGLNTTISFIKDWILFIIPISLISMIILLLPAYLTKFIKIPLMLKNNKPMHLLRNLNHITKILLNIAVITILINSITSLETLIDKTTDNQRWAKGLNYARLNLSSGFAGTIKQGVIDDQSYQIDLSMKQYFKACNEKGALYVNSNGVELPNFNYYGDRQKQAGIDPLEFKLGPQMKINNNYLQVNPIFDINGEQVNIPDHDEHTLYFLVPEKFKKYEAILDKKFSNEFYSNYWDDYKYHIIYIKNNQRYFLFGGTGYSTRMDDLEPYATDIVTIVISNNNMALDSYGCAPCNGLFPKITNTENPYAELLPDMQKYGVTKAIAGAVTLYQQEAANIYIIKRDIIEMTIQLIAAIILLAMIIASTITTYLERCKIKNMIKKLHGHSFFKRNKDFILTSIQIWAISIITIIILNYYYYELSEAAFFLKMPTDLIFFQNPLRRMHVMMNLSDVLKSINWGILLFVMVLDITISLFILKNKETKETITILKGE